MAKDDSNVRCWPKNTRAIRAFSVLCAAANTPFQVPALEVPSGMQLRIKAHPFNAVGSLILVATSAAECQNPNSSWPLILNESVIYAIENSGSLFVSTNIAGSIAIFSSEERRKGNDV